MIRLLAHLCLLFCFISIDANAQYYFVFRARAPKEKFINCEGDPDQTYAGHAFVSLVRRDETIGQTVIDTTWGFNPDKHGKMALVSTPGSLSAVKTCRGDLGPADFMVEVDQVTYQYAWRLTEKWRSRTYGILGNVNCVDFVKDMLDLVIPVLKMPSFRTTQLLKEISMLPLSSVGAQTGQYLVTIKFKNPSCSS